MRARLSAVLLATVLAGAGCGSDGGDHPSPPDSPAPSTTTPTVPNADDAASLGELAEDIASGQATASGPPTASPPVEVPSRVLAISIDGLRSAAISAEATPALHRLVVRGAGTRNARTTVERTETLPNHVCMVTGRRVSGTGGHGVTWNTDTDQRVRSGVASVFTVVADAGGESAVIAGKSKFDIFPDSWPAAVDAFRIEPDMAAAAAAVLAEVRDPDRDLTFWHLAGPDQTGHADGWGSAGYRRSVREADAAVGTVIDALAAERPLAGVSVVLTSDHGGVVGEHGHGAAGHPGNYTIPFAVWGPDAAAANLYDLNPGYADPGGDRTSYAGAQPVRNCDLANVVTGLLGLPDVPGSEFGTGSGLRVSE